jgi:hypothetical protein
MMTVKAALFSPRDAHAVRQGTTQGFIPPVTGSAVGKPETFGLMDLGKGLGAMTALTGATALPGHLYDAYKGGKYVPGIGSAVENKGTLAGLKGMWRGIASKEGLGQLAGKTGRWTWELMKSAPKWALMLGVPLGLMGAYMGARGDKGGATPSAVLSRFGKDLEQKGTEFGRTMQKDRGTLGMVTNVARGYFLEPEAAAAYLWQRYAQ